MPTATVAKATPVKRSVDGSAVQRLFQEEDYRQETKASYEAHTRSTAGKDILERCKRLNEFLESDFLKGRGPQSKEQLKEILDILNAGPKRPSFLDKPAVTATATGSKAQPPPRTHGVAASAQPWGQKEAEQILGLLDCQDDSGARTPAAAVPACSARLPPQHDDVDDLIGLLNAGGPAAASKPVSARSQQDGRLSTHDEGEKQRKEQEAKRLALEAEQARRRIEEERVRQEQEAEAKRIALEQEQIKKKQEEQRRQEQDEQRKRQELEERKRRELEELQRREAELQRQQAEAKAKQERQEAEAKAQRERQEAEAKAKQEAELKRRAQEEERRRKEEEQRRLEEERLRREAAEAAEQARLAALERVQAATAMQAIIRMHLARRACEALRERLHAAVALQSAVRARAARQLLHGMKVEAFRRRRAARCIAACYKAYKERWRLGPVRARNSSTPGVAAMDGHAHLLALPLRLRSTADTRLAPEAASGSSSGAPAGRVGASASGQRTVLTARRRAGELAQQEVSSRSDVGARAVMAGSEHRDFQEAMQAVKASGAGGGRPAARSSAANLPPTARPPSSGSGSMPPARPSPGTMPPARPPSSAGLPPARPPSSGSGSLPSSRPGSNDSSGKKRS